MMRCCRAVPLLLAAVAAQRRGSNYHKGLDDASGLEVAFTSRLSPLYRWACAKAKVGDAIAMLDALEAETAVVIGHDWGAPVAWHTALMRPDRVRGVAGLSVP